MRTFSILAPTLPCTDSMGPVRLPALHVKSRSTRCSTRPPTCQSASPMSVVCSIPAPTIATPGTVRSRSRSAEMTSSAGTSNVPGPKRITVVPSGTISRVRRVTSPSETTSSAGPSGARTWEANAS